RFPVPAKGVSPSLEKSSINLPQSRASRSGGGEKKCIPGPPFQQGERWDKPIRRDLRFWQQTTRWVSVAHTPPPGHVPPSPPRGERGLAIISPMLTFCSRRLQPPPPRRLQPAATGFGNSSLATKPNS